MQEAELMAAELGGAELKQALGLTADQIEEANSETSNDPNCSRIASISRRRAFWKECTNRVSSVIVQWRGDVLTGG